MANNSLEDKNVKMLLVVVVVGLVIYLLVSYLNGNSSNEGFNNNLQASYVPTEDLSEEEEQPILNNLINGPKGYTDLDEDALDYAPIAKTNNNPEMNNLRNNSDMNSNANTDFPYTNSEPNNNVNRANSELGSDLPYNSNNLPETIEGFQNSEPQPSDNTSSNLEEVVQSNNANPNNLPAECYPKDVLSSGDLLPADANSKWAQVNPNGQGSLTDKNFLTAGYHVGVNTVGQSLRNANRQLRSDPPNPQVKVSPWMQTTIEPDINRKPMEIGA